MLITTTGTMDIPGVMEDMEVMEVITVDITVDITEDGETTITLDIMVDGGIPPTTEITGITIPIGVIHQLHVIKITTKPTAEEIITAVPDQDQDQEEIALIPELPGVIIVPLLAEVLL